MDSIRKEGAARSADEADEIIVLPTSPTTSTPTVTPTNTSARQSIGSFKHNILQQFVARNRREVSAFETLIHKNAQLTRENQKLLDRIENMTNSVAGSTATADARMTAKIADLSEQLAASHRQMLDLLQYRDKVRSAKKDRKAAQAAYVGGTDPTRNVMHCF
jgi:ATP-dependent exoDNAse (exonuclease V) beta subunit